MRWFSQARRALVGGFALSTAGPAVTVQPRRSGRSPSSLSNRSRTRRALAFVLAVAATLAVAGWLAVVPNTGEPASRFIVQARDAASAAAAVRAVGGKITHRLEIVRAVGARLTPDQARRLEDGRAARVLPDRVVRVAGKPGLVTDYPKVVWADLLHYEGVTGAGVTVAFLDSGAWSHLALNKTTDGAWRNLAQYDAITGQQVTFGTAAITDDDCGHGTHVASVALSSISSSNRKPIYNGVAPDANYVSVKAFDGAGVGTYADVIRGIEWVVANRDTYAIRVLNCSFSAAPRSHYWEDPLNQAVMAAWQAGIVVVVSAGNGGPDPMTVGVPANVPYVVSVGAMSDSYTPYDETDDSVASFSAAGPTYEGFVKPDVIAPGGHVMGIMPVAATIPTEHPELHDGSKYFTMSGTSQAAAVVSGVVALMLQVAPALSPDDVKCRLMCTARPRTDSGSQNGVAEYSLFQQGAGLVHAWDAVYSDAHGCVNQGLDVTNDLYGIEHYGGRANQAPDGSFYLMDPEDDEGDGDGILDGDGYTWTGAYLWNDGWTWSSAYLWNDGYLWNDAFLWNDAYLWNDGYLWNDAYLWNQALTEPMAVNAWVPQE